MKKIQSTCNYCAIDCNMDFYVEDGKIVKVLHQGTVTGQAADRYKDVPSAENPAGGRHHERGVLGGGLFPCGG